MQKGRARAEIATWRDRALDSYSVYRYGGPNTTKKIIFLHVPKTAGTSFSSMLQEIYPGPRTLLVYSHDFATDAGAAATLTRSIRRAEAIAGHFHFGIHKLWNVQAQYFTVLRDPVARVVSFYQHAGRDDTSAYYSDISRGMSLRDLLESGQCEEVRNHTVRLICGLDHFDEFDETAMLELAWRNLNSEAFVPAGITERLDDSISMIGQALAWPVLPTMARLNVAPTAFTLDAATRSEIVRHNALDIELYRRADVGLSQWLRARGDGAHPFPSSPNSVDPPDSPRRPDADSSPPSTDPPGGAQ